MLSVTDRLQSLYASNRPPSPQEASAAAELLQVCDRKLQVVDTRITALERELEELKAQRSIIEGERHRYVDILSARRLLPPEIIGRFMESACMNDNDDDSESSQSLGTHHQGLPYMLVSREWYRTACGVAHFWTELDMDLTNSSAEEIQEIFLKATNRSARAAEIPLSLKIAFSAAAPSSTQIVDFIHSLISRLGHITLRLYVDSISDLQILNSLFHNPPSSSTLLWPTLHTLQIFIQSVDRIAAESELSIPSANFPLLRTAAISLLGVVFPSYQMPCSDLIRLDLGPLSELTSPKYVHILGTCTNLRSLRLRMQCLYRVFDDTDNIAIILPHLTHLHIESPAKEEPGRSLLPLQLPSLQSCIYTTSTSGCYYCPIIAQLTRLFARSGCSESMEYLELDLGFEAFYRVGDLDDLLLEVPCLTALKLSGFRMEMHALRNVPLSVRELSINLSRHILDESRGAFVKYLYSRFDASPDDPLKARLHFVDTRYTFAVRERLESLKNKVGSSLDAVMD
ncbi:hypothetical protein EST38_g5575 [Candolleomyces aberdarensis]|uniref:F-box domain-containing protein n=1 Tax=Candolleomyces aberdarensis TaxID=2316362 RepID=A0A4Q2DLZ0_9AGAR|nr:hypothetical protein EST38_g5575 [Candolleomyces aberdarensis]